MMYLFEKPNTATKAEPLPQPFNWKEHQDAGE
jgi:hypothetical protein